MMEEGMQSGSLIVVRRALATAALALVASGPPFAALADESHAREILKAMSDYLAAQDTISFDYDATLEVVTVEDQKLGIASSGTVRLDRPDRLRATRKNGFIDVEMIFDGSSLTVHGKNANLYTQMDAPGTVDELLDELRSNLGLPMPAADLLMSDPYDVLIGPVTDVKDLGSGMIGGVECDWLAFRTEQVDWQIWIARGDEPYPCRYVITTKQMAHAPQYTIQVRDWRTGEEPGADAFAFSNETGATEIALEDLVDSLGEMPEHFTEETKQ
jgi:hypothetical protein